MFAYHLPDATLSNLIVRMIKIPASALKIKHYLQSLLLYKYALWECNSQPCVYLLSGGFFSLPQQ